MDPLFANVAGLDVHLASVSCAVRCCQPPGKSLAQVRSFGTMTGDRRARADYLRSVGVTHVALESTGVLWKPVGNVLEGRFTLLLVNPRHLKKVPGRKTDKTDAEGLAPLLQCGLLRARFVPPRPVRERRDWTRQRTQLTAEHTRVANRIHKVLEDANIKLQAVASDVLGKSGRALLAALVKGETDPGKRADLALGVPGKKVDPLRRAMDGHGTEHHRYQLARLLSHLNYLERQSDPFGPRIGRRVADLLPPETVSRLDGIPG